MNFTPFVATSRGIVQCLPDNDPTVRKALAMLETLQHAMGLDNYVAWKISNFPNGISDWAAAYERAYRKWYTLVADCTCLPDGQPCAYCLNVSQSVHNDDCIPF
jgi:hypothetical protein